MDDLSRFCCGNKACKLHGVRHAGNLRVRGYYGKECKRLLCCKVCQARFSEARGTPLFNAKLPRDKVLAVLEHLHEGCGIRSTARLVGVHRNTVARLAKLAGTHAKALHDELAAFSPSDAGGAVRRKVVVRGQKAAALPRRRSR